MSWTNRNSGTVFQGREKVDQGFHPAQRYLLPVSAVKAKKNQALVSP
jgi:hypothetical protein